ncbi:MAG: DUF177 domain-containing protein [bacterium]
MKINIKDIVGERTNLVFTVPVAHFDISPDEAVLRKDIQVNVKIEKIRKEILIRGTINTQLELECSRCLNHFLYPVAENFQTIFQPFSPRTLDEEIELAKEDLDIEFYQDDIIDLTEIVRDQILLSIPMIPVCEPACQGLCPQCGQNLNQARCQCVTETVDPRWQKLQYLAKKKTL